MATTASTTKTALCLVGCNGLTVTVKSIKTGKAVKVTFPSPTPLYHRLTEDVGVMDCEMQVSHDDMRAILTMSQDEILQKREDMTLRKIDRLTSVHMPRTGTPEEREIKYLQKVASKCTEKLYQFGYDITGRKVPNPAAILHGIGLIHLLESGWIARESDLRLPEMQDLIQYWDTEGIDYDIIPQGEEARTILLTKAQQRLDKRIRQLHTSLIQRIASANDRYEEAMHQEAITPNEAEQADSYRDNTIRSILKGCGEALNASISCAEKFDTTMEVQDLLDALRAAIQSEAQAFNALMLRKGSKPAPMPK